MSESLAGIKHFPPGRSLTRKYDACVTRREQICRGVYLDESERTPETIAARFAEISDARTAEPLKDAFGQTMKFVAAAAKAKGVSLE
jgi:hypothetical protein